MKISKKNTLNFYIFYKFLSEIAKWYVLKILEFMYVVVWQIF